MYFSFNLLSSTMLVLFTHLLVTALLVWRIGLSGPVRSGMWLGSLLILLALYISPFMLGYAGWYGKDGYRELLFFLPLQQLFVIGPVMLFYLRNLLYPADSFRKRDWLHFLPGLTYLAYSLVMFIADVLVLEEPFFYADGRDRDLDAWYQIAGYLSLIAYFWMSLALYQRYQRQIFDELSYAEEITYQWVRYFLVIFLAILLLRGLFFILNPEWGEFGKKYWYYLAISVIGYFLAIRGYRQVIEFKAAGWERMVRNVSLSANPLREAEEEAAEEAEPPFDADQWLERIRESMLQEHLYQNSTLTLSDLAGHVGTNSRTISRAINVGTGMNFNDYINSFRVEAVIRDLNAGAHQQLTLMGIAFACGFNSKSTFNRAFKKQAGMSPGQYLEKSKKDGAKS